MTIKIKFSFYLFIISIRKISSTIHTSRYNQGNYNFEFSEDEVQSFDDPDSSSAQHYGSFEQKFPKNEELVIVDKINQPKVVPVEETLITPSTKKFKNMETKLIDTLFDGYDPRARPVLNYSQPIMVNFSLTLTQIDDMNIKDQILSTGLWINYLWYDAFLKWDPARYDNIRAISIPINKIWKPDIILYNSVSENFDPSYPTHAKIFSDGLVNWLPPAMVTTSCNVDVRFFPFDRQICPFIFGPWTNDVTTIDMQLQYGEGAASIDTSEMVDSNTWDDISVTAHRLAKRFESTPNDPAYVKCIFVLRMRRCHTYGMMNYITPCLIVTAMALLVFILPPDAGEKIGLSITVLLTLVVFQQMLADATPATKDGLPVPVIASFFEYTMLIVMGSTLITVLVLNMHHTDVNLEETQMPPFFRYLFLVFLPKVMFMKQFEGEGIDDLSWSGRKNIQLANDIRSSSKSKSNHRTESEENISLSSTFPKLRQFDNVRSRNQSPDIERPISTACMHQEVLLSEHDKDMLEVLKEIRKITEHISDENEAGSQADEWKFAAIVFDRFCLYSNFRL